VRLCAIEELRHWMALQPDADGRLSVLVQSRQQFSPTEAATFLQLLHGFSTKERADPATYATLIAALQHARLPIRELASWNLYHLAPQAARKIAYDAAAGPVERERAQRQWRTLIPEGKLPPPEEKSGSG